MKNNIIDLKNGEIDYYLDKLKYSLFTDLKKVDEGVLLPHNFNFLIKGFQYDDCFFIIDFDALVVKVYPIDLNIMDGISSSGMPGVFVYGIVDLDITNDDVSVHRKFIENNLEVIRQLDSFYKSFAKTDDIPFSNDATFLYNLAKQYNKPIPFKK